MVDEDAIRETRRTRIETWRSWDAGTLVHAVEALLARKDAPTRIHGGPYHQYWVVLHNDEPELRHERFRDLIEGVTFGPFRVIVRAFVFFSYDRNIHSVLTSGDFGGLWNPVGIATERGYRVMEEDLFQAGVDVKSHLIRGKADKSWTMAAAPGRVSARRARAHLPRAGAR